MKKIIKRIQPFLIIGVSGLVLLICIAGIAGIWLVEGAASSSTVQMLKSIDNVTQRMRDGITKVDTGLARLEESVSSVEAASAQLSQTVSDKGLLLTLLPTTKEQELTATAQLVRDSFAAIWDVLKAAKEIVQAINGLPFIDLPGDGLASIETTQERMVRLTDQVEDLKAKVREFRSQAALNVSTITEATASLTSLLAEVHSDLSGTDAELYTIQVQSRQIQKILPIALLSSAVVMTLLAIWIGYSQFVMIRRAIRQIQGHRNSSATDEPFEQEIQSIDNKDGKASEPIQTEAGENSPGNTEQNNSKQS